MLVDRRRIGTKYIGLRSGRKKAETIAARYSLRVRARAPEPFVRLPKALLRETAARRLAGFWDRVLRKAGV